MSAGTKHEDAVVGEDRLARRSLFGLDFVDAPSLHPVVEAVLSHRCRIDPTTRDGGALPAVLTPNVDILVSLDADPVGPAASVYRRAQYILPDGMPIVVASRLLGVPLASRLPGSGLFEILWPRLVPSTVPFVVVCANDEIAAGLATDRPDAGYLVPPMVDARNSEQLAVVAKEILELVTTHGAELLLVGLGHPKDALIIDRVNELWDRPGPPPLGLGLGGSFAMYIGQKRRAPAWMQRAGLEWFFRFLQEPRRLFRRYFIDDVAFIGLVRRERRRLAGRPRQAREVQR